MLYFHGTDVLFKDFDIGFSGLYKDFGAGIYLSKGKNHAKSIALRKIGFDKNIRIYDINTNDMYNLLNVKKFEKPTVEWVKFVILNRIERVSTFYDVIIGPTADSITNNIIKEFLARFKNFKPKEEDYLELIDALKPYKYDTQVCLKSKKAVDYFNTNLKKIERL